MTAIVDTNVVLVANGQHQDVTQACVNHCAERLQQLMNSGRIALDEGFLILLEYQNKTNSKSQKGPRRCLCEMGATKSCKPGKMRSCPNH